MSTSDPPADQYTPPSQSKLPLNRIVAFLGPYIAVVSGAIANWLATHVHLLSAFHISQKSVAGAISQISIFGITALLVWAGQHKWLTGWQQWESTIAGEIFSGPAVTPPTGEYDPSTAGGESAPV